MKPRNTAKKSSRDINRSMRQGKNTIHKEILDWLRDAYSMERAQEHSLQKQAANKDLSDEVRHRAATHLEETRGHAERVRALLEGLGTKTSALKTTVGRLTQGSKGLATMFARDERIKDLLDAYSMEHFEIACYTALAEAAERAGLPQIAQTCWRIIPDEERMAESLLDALPDQVADYIFETETEKV